MLPGVGVCGTDPDIIRILALFLREYGFSIEAMWGKTLREAEELSLELKIPYFSNKMDDVLLRKNVDLVFIVAPPHLHAQVSNKALGIGKHVIVYSQPLGLGQSDALKMTRASQYYPSLIALTGHTLRFLPGVTQMRRLIHEKSFLTEAVVLLDFRLQMGALFPDKYDWLCDATMGGGILSLYGSHLVDLASFLLKQRAVRVNGTVRTHTQGTENISGIRRVTAPDFCSFQLEMEGGALVTVSLHSHQCIGGAAAASFFSQDLKVAASDGSYLVLRGNDLFGQRGQRQAKGKGEEVLYVDDSASPTDQHLLPRPHAKGLSKMVAALREAFLPVQEQTGWIKSPVETAASFEDGLYVQAVLEAVRRSNEERSWVPVTIQSESPTN